MARKPAARARALGRHRHRRARGVAGLPLIALDAPRKNDAEHKRWFESLAFAVFFAVALLVCGLISISAWPRKRPIRRPRSHYG